MHPVWVFIRLVFFFPERALQWLWDHAGVPLSPWMP